MVIVKQIWQVFGAHGCPGGPGSWAVLGRWAVLDGVGSLCPMALATAGSHGWPWLAIAGFELLWLAMAGHAGHGAMLLRKDAYKDCHFGAGLPQKGSS